MSKQHSYAEIAQDFSLWGEYVDRDATMTEAEFDALSVEQKIALQVEAFGEEIRDELGADAAAGV